MEFNRSQEERLHFIDFNLCYYGSITRSALINRFGISGQAATNDIGKYRKLAPKNVFYNPSTKAFYIIEELYKPVYQFPDELVEIILFHGVNISFLGMNDKGGICERLPRLNCENFDQLPFFTRSIAQGKPLRINYYSFNSNRLSTRVIVPHTIVDTHSRWHVRAFDRDRREFRDFVLNRASDPEILDESPELHEMKNADSEWFRYSKVRFHPHPASPYKEGIVKQYNMVNDELEVEVRDKLKFYFYRANPVDDTVERSMNPKRFHLVPDGDEFSDDL